MSLKKFIGIILVGMTLINQASAGLCDWIWGSSHTSATQTVAVETRPIQPPRLRGGDDTCCETPCCRPCMGMSAALTYTACSVATGILSSYLCYAAVTDPTPPYLGTLSALIGTCAANICLKILTATSGNIILTDITTDSWNRYRFDPVNCECAPCWGIVPGALFAVPEMGLIGYANAHILPQGGTIAGNVLFGVFGIATSIWNFAIPYIAKKLYPTSPQAPTINVNVPPQRQTFNINMPPVAVNAPNTNAAPV